MEFKETHKWAFNEILRRCITSDSLVEDTAWSSEVEWSASWINITAFAQVIQVLDFVSERIQNMRIKMMK